ncbi:MAG: single-stranded DNA-binding protein [bacterium]|nr:single-stranded DNA-binding protein [bacterium]
MLNTVTLVGRLVQDPIIKEVSGGKNVCEVKLALTRPFKNVQGQYDTDFIKVVFWEYLAINLNEYGKKGSIIGVRARLQSRSMKISDNYVDVIDVVAEQIVYLGSPNRKVESKIDEKVEDIPLDELDDVK